MKKGRLALFSFPACFRLIPALFAPALRAGGDAHFLAVFGDGAASAVDALLL